MTEKEIIQKIYEAIKLVDCMQYNPLVDFNYLRAKGAYNIIKNQVEHIEAENTELRARLEKAVELPTIYEHISYPYIERMYSEIIYYVIYKENGRIMTEKFGKNKSKAEARLKELKEKKDD